MNTDENPENTVERATIDVEPLKEDNIVLTGDDIMPLESPKYEIIDFEGAEARFYPRTGAIMVFDEAKNRWIIRANRGGRKDFDGKAMVAARELKKEQAIIDGLVQAASELDMRFATSATGMLSAIVAARAKNAYSDEGRTGNADAKFIFSIVGANSEGGEEGPSLRVDMDADTAAGFIAAMKDLMAQKDSE